MNQYLTPAARGARTASILNIIAGIWLIISPFILAYSVSAATTNSVICGIIAIIIGWIRAADPSNRVSGLSWINVLLGLWLIWSPFAVHFFPLRAALYNSVIMGIIVTLLALWSAISSSTIRTRAMPRG
jgi:hypothetical protein